MDRGTRLGRARKSVVWETIETIAIALILTVFIRHFVVESYVVKGMSMEPTLHDGERLLVSKFSYRLRPPRPGDIIIFRSPLSPRDDLIKRVIAVGGDRVEVVGGEASVNGKPMDERYISRPDGTMVPPIRVPYGRMFVMGDNRPNSEDSRVFGPVSTDRVKGKAVLVWWPFSYFAVLR